jgi:hypothetical protein
MLMTLRITKYPNKQCSTGLLTSSNSKLKFTMEHETSNMLTTFLDRTLINQYKELEFHVYKKPTSTDLIIPNDFLPFKQKSRNKLSNSQLAYFPRRKLRTNHNHKGNIKNHPNTYITKLEQKWATFPYPGKESHTISRLKKQ